MLVRLGFHTHKRWTISSHKTFLRFTLLLLQASRSPYFPTVPSHQMSRCKCPRQCDTEWQGTTAGQARESPASHSPLSAPSLSWAEAASLGCSPSSSEGVTPFTIFCCTDGGGVGGSDEGGVGGLLTLFWGVGWVLCARWHRDTGIISWPHMTPAFSSSLTSPPPTPTIVLFPESVAIVLTLVSS